MKIFTTLLLVFIPAGTQSGARGQAVISPAVIPVPLTKLEAFAATTGTLLATETYSLLGIYGEHSCNIRVQVIDHHVRDRAGSWESAGLRVEIADSTRKNMVAAYIDLDELENLSKAINSMLDMNRQGTSFTNPASKELFFSSTGGLKIAMVQRDTEKNWS